MPAFSHAIDVAADPAAAWRVLGDLASVDRWIPDLVKVEVDGMTRQCMFADGHVQHEQILDYSPATRSFRYTIEGGLPVTDNQGRFAIEPAGDGARIVWESSFEPLDPAAGPQLTQLWQGMLPVVLTSLKTVIEEG